MSETATTPAIGTAYMEIEVKGRWALSILTEGWTEEEVQALYDGDDEAREELKAQLQTRVLTEPDEIDALTVEIHLGQRRPAST